MLYLFSYKCYICFLVLLGGDPESLRLSKLPLFVILECYFSISKILSPSALLGSFKIVDNMCTHMHTRAHTAKKKKRKKEEKKRESRAFLLFFLTEF